LAVLCIAACTRATTPAGAAAPLPAAHANEVLFIGMCDASGAVPLSAHTFAVADDEDNVLRVYDADRGGKSLYERDISAGIGIPVRQPKGGHAPKPPAEADIEAATRHGDIALWLTSHSRNSKGKLRPERLRFFATSLPLDGHELQVIGRPYSALIDDLSADPRFAGFELQLAAQRAPKTREGLNIEGLSERIQGGVLIGLRAPNPGGRALLFALENPERVVAGEPPKFGPPILLDLSGLGVRAITRWRDHYLLVAGDWGSTQPSRLFEWDGVSESARAISADFHGFNPEGFFLAEERNAIMLLSDDGTEQRDGTACKDRSDPSQKSFRGRWLQLSAL
jgi:hypothetical protein